MHYSFQALYTPADPAAEARSAEVLAAVAGGAWGIEVIPPSVAAQCSINLDPRASGATTAIELALTHPLPPDGTTFALTGFTLASVGAATVFELRRAMGDGAALPPSVVGSLELVIDAERRARDWRREDLPSAENRWPVPGSRDLAAIDGAVRDKRLDLSGRVRLMQAWLLTGREPGGYLERAERRRHSLIERIAARHYRVQTAAGGRIAVVEAANPQNLELALTVAYANAPVAVIHARRPPTAEGQSRRTFRLGQLRPGYARVRDTLRELAEQEPEWHGDEFFGYAGGSVRSVRDVVSGVARHLIDPD